MSTKTRRYQKTWRPGGYDPTRHNKMVALRRTYRALAHQERHLTLALGRASRAFDRFVEAQR